MNNGKHIDPVKTGSFIAELRKAHNMTQDELGELIFISRKSVSKWETGKCCPSIDMLKKLSENLGVSLEDLVEGDFTQLQALKNKSFIYKAVHNRTFKMTSLVSSTFVFLSLLIFFFYNHNATKVFAIAYQDKNFLITNGTVVLSNIRNYIDLGNFYSNIDDIKDDTDYNFILYTVDDDKEKPLVKFNEIQATQLDKKVSKELKEILTKDKNNIYLKIFYTNNNNKETCYDIKLFSTEKSELEESINATDAFSKNVIGVYDPNILLKKKLSPIEKPKKVDISDSIGPIDLSFIFDTSVSDLKKIFVGKEFKIDGEKYKVEYDDFDNSLIIFSKTRNVVIYQTLKRIKIFDRFTYIVDDNNLLYLKNDAAINNLYMTKTLKQLLKIYNVHQK